MKNFKKCKICGKEFNAKKKQLCCSLECSKENERQWTNKVHKVYRARVIDKLSGIKLQSGCKICGYKKSVRALCFHHLGNKEIRLSGVRAKRDKVFEEVNKCVVLCSNCHMEVHEGLIKL